jgi:Zn-dependent protease
MAELIGIIIVVFCILIALTVHEFAHAFTADRLGDPTPRLAGRLTLNPISHIDPFGFIMLVLVHFGWAKPVPINPYNFKDPDKGEMLVSLAGPFSNILLAWVLVKCIKLFPELVLGVPLYRGIVTLLIQININLAVFNLLPIPPLDGSHIFARFLPYELRARFEQYGFLLLYFIAIFPPTSQLLMLLFDNAQKLIFAL